MLQPAETERAGLAVLSRLHDHDARLQAVLRIARSIQAEDGERRRRRWAGGTGLRIDGDPTTFEALEGDERRRLMVRVLCELVAYGEDIDTTSPVRGRLAANVS